MPSQLSYWLISCETWLKQVLWFPFISRLHDAWAITTFHYQRLVYISNTRCQCPRSQQREANGLECGSGLGCNTTQWYSSRGKGLLRTKDIQYMHNCHFLAPTAKHAHVLQEMDVYSIMGFIRLHAGNGGINILSQ